ncbi:hypothetical protein QAD02_015092 [Eretmocerus hayati]|uniref:Uncharacterized protein n=1 Tax=Eretmocerus hayati TaxID=131215 RepID=A0ACC2PC27_9HYME|nr:hypothetical protein QAD02_015092 [Eretmocerus hayati]
MQGVSDEYENALRSGYPLDLLFGNASNWIYLDLEDELLPTDLHHIPCVLQRNHAEPLVTLRTNCVKLDFRNADYQKIDETLNLVDWAVELSGKDFQACVEEFHDILSNIICKFVSPKKIYVDRFPQWFNYDLKKLVRCKRDLLKARKSSNRLEDRISYSKARAECKRATRLAYESYIAKIESNISDDELFKPLESVQHNVIRYASKKSKSPVHYLDHDYSPYLGKYNLLTIEKLHTCYDYFAMYKILKGHTKCVDLSSKFIPRDAPYNVRNIRPILGENVKPRYLAHAPVNRLRRLWDQLDSTIRDTEKITRFKSTVKDRLLVPDSQ